jgi:hypothetical protein
MFSLPISAPRSLLRRIYQKRKTWEKDGRGEREDSRGEEKEVWGERTKRKRWGIASALVSFV